MNVEQGSMPIENRIVGSLTSFLGETQITYGQFLESVECSVSELFDFYKENPGLLSGLLKTFNIRVVSEIDAEDESKNDLLTDFRERENLQVHNGKGSREPYSFS